MQRNGRKRDGQGMTGRKRCFAHSLEGRTIREWPTLEDHLKKVAKMAEEFPNCSRGTSGRGWRDCGMSLLCAVRGDV